MSPDDNSSFDELLRSAMAEEADTVVPAGDGLARIQQRVRDREGRVRWMRPALALGSAAVVAAAGVGVAAIVNNTRDDKLGVTPSTPQSTEPVASSTTEPVTNITFPAQAIFPFTTAAAEQGWEQDYQSGGTQWEADPTLVAQRWVEDFLDQPTVDRVISTTDDGSDKVVTLGRILQAEGQNLFPVTTVHLTPYDNAWIVTGATDPNSYLSFTTPEPGSTIITPVAVTGPGFGVDEAVQLDVRDATSTTSYGTTTVSFGNGTPLWRGSINFNRPTSPVGVLLAVDHSPADGGPSRIVAEQVQFAPAAPNQPPPYFYAVKNNRITKFASRTGSPINYLTTEQPGGGVSDPQVVGTDVYYLQGAGTCANALMKVPTSADGTAAGESVASPDNGYVITAYSVGDTAISTFESACDPARSPQGRVVTTPTVSGPTAHSIDFPSFPPTIIGDPSFESGEAQFLVAIVKTGTESSIVRYDPYNDSSPTPNRPACAGLGPQDGEPEAIQIDATDTAWIALRTGSSMDVVRCSGGKAKVAFTIPGNDQPADIAVTSDGSAVLLTDINGKVWLWDGSGNPNQLQTSLPLDHVSW